MPYDQLTAPTDCWMQTFTGKRFRPLEPDAADICIEDIAHALANQCRYAGHCKTFYSVADHSVRVSHACPQEHALWGLLHDAAEAYLVDLPRPIKQTEAIGDPYRKAEARLEVAIAQRFCLPLPIPPEVKTADNVLLFTEQRDLMGTKFEWRGSKDYEPLPLTIVPMTPVAAEIAFLDRYAELTR